MSYPSPLLLLLLCWRPHNSALGFISTPAATYRYHHSSLKLEFDDFSQDLDTVVSSGVINGRSTAAISGDNNIHVKTLHRHGDNNIHVEKLHSQTDVSNFYELQSVFQSEPISYTSSISNSLLHKLKSSGFMNDNDIALFAMDFAASRPEIISQILIQDFAWDALDAHRARVGITHLVRGRLEAITNNDDSNNNNKREVSGSNLIDTSSKINQQDSHNQLSLPLNDYLGAVSHPTTDNTEDKEQQQELVTKPKLAPWKSVLVNDKAKLRRRMNIVDNTQSSNLEKDSYNYGLLDNDSDRSVYATMFTELDNFWSFMTVLQTSSVAEPPIRERTAEVYMRHARLFLGWVVDARDNILDTDLFEELDDDEDVPSTAIKSSSPLSTSTSKASALSESLNVRKSMWKRLRQRMGKEMTDEDMKKSLSLTDIFFEKETESATVIVKYILWLRSERSVSANYEANILRGLIKMVKFRFAGELSLNNNTIQSATSKTPLDDLPVVVELRKFHREAGNRSKKAPRSSDEGKKWLDWSEYLEVIELLKADLGHMIERYEEMHPEQSSDVGMKQQKALLVQQKEIATIFQHYLILSFFACVPDRQRTFRELELNKNFLRIDGDSNEEDTYVIRHSADDYKTGKTYGERPPLPLLPSLTPAIDDFIERWRPCLLKDSKDEPSPSAFLFHQPKTGNPLTPNSMYQIVSRCCYRYKQKKTNPHLLRDMIVTHVRKNSDASEKELEALALYMGHSVQMQRESYDRRTLEQKVMPAVSLMQSINTADKKQ